MHTNCFTRFLRRSVVVGGRSLAGPTLATFLPAAAWAAVVNPVLAPNPNRIPLGDIGALEGGAIVARSSDAAATCDNPTGLVRALQP